MSDQGNASQELSAARSARLLRARIAFAVISVGSWLVFLGAKTINDAAGEGTVEVPVFQLTLPAMAALYLVFRYPDGIARDDGLRWQVLSMTGLTFLVGVLMAVTADGPPEALYWTAVLALAASVPLSTRRIPRR